MTESIDLRQLRYFLAVCEERNISRAALRLHISQPPLTRQIHQLETRLGVRLFVRTHAGVTLTAAGEAFLPEVRATLARLQHAIDVARRSQDTGAGSFCVGYTTVFDLSLIPDVLASLRQRLPHWRIESRGAHSIDLIRDIRKGELDAAFVGLHSDIRGLESINVQDDPLVVALPSGHRLAKRRSLRFADLRAEPMFWFERRLNPGFYDYCQDFFHQIDFKPPMIAEPADHHILLGRIAEGQGLALIPASMQKIRRQGVVFRRLQQEGRKLSMGIALVYAADNTSAALSTLRGLLQMR